MFRHALESEQSNLLVPRFQEIVVIVVYTAANMLSTARTEDTEAVGAPQGGALQT